MRFVTNAIRLQIVTLSLLLVSACANIPNDSGLSNNQQEWLQEVLTYKDGITPDHP